MIENVLALNKRGLTTDLGTNLIVRETGSGEERNLLATGNGVHHVNGRDTCLDHLLWVHSLIGVNRLALYLLIIIRYCEQRRFQLKSAHSYLNIKELFCENWRTVVNWGAGAVEGASEHLNADWHAQHVACELDVSVQVVDS